MTTFWITLLVITYSFFAFAQMAFTSSKKAVLKRFTEQGTPGAQEALTISSSSFFPLATQLPMTLAALIGAVLFGTLLTPTFQDNFVNFAIIGSLLCLGWVVCFDWVPRRLGSLTPEKTAVFLAPFFKKILFVVERVIPFKLLKITPITEDDVRTIVEHNADLGIFDKTETSLIKRVLKLGEITAGDIMTSRMKLISIDIDEPIEKNLDTMFASKHTYFPVYRGQPENIIGLLSIKLLLNQFRLQNKIDLTQAMVSPMYLPDRVSCAKLLETFRAKKSHLALLIDEFGGLAGMVTVSDLLEVVIGDMVLNVENQEQKIVTREDGSFLVDGMASLFDLEEILNVQIPTENLEYQTIGGLVMRRIGRIPREGDIFSLLDHRFEVVDMDGRRVDKVLISKGKDL